MNAAPAYRTCGLLVASCLLAGVPGVGSVAGGPEPLSAQTPEQRYSDWVRPGFRPQEYEFRRNRILDGLRATGGGLLLVPSSDGITHGETFRQLEDFWYLTGLEVPQSMLVLDARRDISILFMPQSDPRFENPGRPNDFPGPSAAGRLSDPRHRRCRRLPGRRRTRGALCASAWGGARSFA